MLGDLTVKATHAVIVHDEYNRTCTMMVELENGEFVDVGGACTDEVAYLQLVLLGDKAKGMSLAQLRHEWTEVLSGR